MNRLRFFLFVLAFSLPTTVVHAATVSLAPPSAPQSSKAINLTTLVEPAEALAGVKLVLDYDPTLLHYENGFKTRESAMMMHVVNSRNPGHLVLVMAAAKGISGANVPIFVFQFSPGKELTSSSRVNVRISAVELMNDSLKPITAEAGLCEFSLGGKPAEVSQSGERASE